MAVEPGKAIIPDEPAEALPAATSRADAGQRVGDLERLRYRATRRRGPTTLANAPAENTADSGPAALAAFCAAALPPAQVFVLRPDRDTIVIGAQGTQLFLPADAFDVPPGGGPVQLELREFYSMPDIILAGLSTRSGNQLLETGGMLHLAATAGGRPVQLRPGNQLALRLPTAEVKPGMQLFEGGHAPAGRIDWRLPALPALPRSLADTLAHITLRINLPTGSQYQAYHRNRSKKHLPATRSQWQWPEYPDGPRRLRKDLAAAIPYPATTVARLRRGRRISKGEQQTLREASQEHRAKILRMVRLEFFVDSTGVVTRTAAPPGSDAELARLVGEALRGLPRWQPGHQPAYLRRNQTQPATLPGRITVAFGDAGQLFVTDPEWDVRRGYERYAARGLALQQARYDSIWKAQEPLRRARQLAWEREQKVAADRIRSREAAVRARNPALVVAPRKGETPADTLNNAGYALGQVYYELNSQGLGWINCDRFAYNNIPRVTLAVQTEEADVLANLVFRSVRSMMDCQVEGPGRVLFGNIPAGEQATLVALKRQNGVTYLALKPVVVSQTTVQGLQFRPVTAAELRAALAPLQAAGNGPAPVPTGGQ